MYSSYMQYPTQSVYAVIYMLSQPAQTASANKI